MSLPAPDSPVPHRAPPSKRAALLPPSREIPFPAAERLGHQPSASTRKASLPLPSPSEASLVPPPRPPRPPSLEYLEQELWELGQTKEESQVQDEIITLPPPVLPPTRKPSLPPPTTTTEGRISIESRRSTDPRHTYEERRASGQYSTVTPPAVLRPSSPPP